MIVIGVDVHKQSVTAVAADEVGRVVDERTVASGSDELLDWAGSLSEGRLWALEDCRRLTRWLERQLLGAGEELVRVPPKLMAPERRHGRSRGKSDRSTRSRSRGRRSASRRSAGPARMKSRIAS